MALYEFDFTGAPPAQGSLGSDVIPAGRYRAKLDEIKDGTTRNGDKKMVSVKLIVSKGEMSGKVLRDNFVYTGDSSDAPFGLRRLHAFFLACGLGVAERKVKIEFDKLPGREFEVDVKDDVIAANDRYEARPTSRVDAYFPLAKPAAAPAPSAPPAEAPAPAPAPAAKKAAAPAAAAVAEAVEDDVTDVVDDAPEASDADIAEVTDDLFS